MKNCILLKNSPLNTFKKRYTEWQKCKTYRYTLSTFFKDNAKFA